MSRPLFDIVTTTSSYWKQKKKIAFLLFLNKKKCVLKSLKESKLYNPSSRALFKPFSTYHDYHYRIQSTVLKDIMPTLCQALLEIHKLLAFLCIPLSKALENTENHDDAV